MHRYTFKSMDLFDIFMENGARCGDHTPGDIHRWYGKDILGHLFEALTWLANHLADDGAPLQSGF